jgi:hypothetical protein
VELGLEGAEKMLGALGIKGAAYIGRRKILGVGNTEIAAAAACEIPAESG